MKYRILGRTGLKVSVISYGASPLGSVFEQIDEKEGVRAVHAALDRGINLIDVSPYYGLTRAETVLGMALEGVARDRYILATKVGRYGAEIAQFDFSAKRVVQSVEESLKRLKVEHVDLIQCHDIEFGSLDQIVEETLPALRGLQKKGWVRWVGITGLPLKVFREVLKRTEVDSILSYCHYSLNDTALSGLLPTLEEKGVGVISASPLSMGLLTERGPPSWHPAPTPLKECCRQALEFCKERGADLSELALQFALENPKIHTTLVGLSKVRNVEKNLKALEKPLDRELLNDVLKIFEPVADLTWPSGRPENNL